MITLPRDDLQKQRILSMIAHRFERDKDYMDEEVNDIIKSFDVDDYILFKRELVKFNYLGKDHYKGTYWVEKFKTLTEELKKMKKNQDTIS